MDLLDNLAQEFNQDTILFIGSGVSITAGLPTWGTLINWLREYTHEQGCKVDAADSFIGKKDFIKAASALTLELTKEGKSLANFFIEYQDCQIFHNAEPQEIHNLLLEFPTNSFITPNYDLLIEKAAEKKGREIQIVHKAELAALNEIKRDRVKDYLYKYHGCITKPENIILDYEHYNKEIHGNSADIECLKNRIQSKTFVFIGAGLEDPDFNHIRDSLIHKTTPKDIEFWAFMPNCEAEVEFYQQQYGTNLISYKMEDNDHSDLLNKLNELLITINNLDKVKFDDVNMVVNQYRSSFNQVGVLRQILVTANEHILPIDEQILGFVAFFDGIERTECESYMIGYKNSDDVIINNRINYLLNQDLLKATEHYLLPIKENFSIEAAELIEDDIIGYLMERENG